MTRKSKNLKTRKSVAIFCEGKSEQQYFNMLKQKYRQSMIKIKVIDSKLSGKNLVEKVIKTAKSNRKMSNSKKYVVFDRDEHKKDELMKCQKLAEKNGITILFSSIDFEIWILMHFEKVLESNNYSRKDLVEKLSGKNYFNQDYLKFKGNDYRDFLYDKVQNAFNNASKLYDDHHNLITDDPFTNIHRYLKEIFQTDKF